MTDFRDDSLIPALTEPTSQQISRHLDRYYTALLIEERFIMRFNNIIQNGILYKAGQSVNLLVFSYVINVTKYILYFERGTKYE